jgi:hypothetical protein
MMKFVPADTIDAVIELLDNVSDEQYEQRMEDFAEAQPVIFAYLFDEENFHLLTEDEKGFMQYLALIIWAANEQVNGTAPEASEEQIGAAEERNYAVLDGHTARDFSDRVDPLFEDYPQEDLLAFVEEALLEDEEEPEVLITKEGREPIFVALKTVIDVLINHE